MEKYYTPSIEEFYEGFEYEYSFNNSEFIKEKFSSGDIDEMAGDWYEFSPNNPKSKCRVKYLDEEDIKNIGFVKMVKNEWAGWHDYILNNISGEIGYFLKATIHKPRMDDIYKIYLHRYLENDTKI